MPKSSTLTKSEARRLQRLSRHEFLSNNPAHLQRWKELNARTREYVIADMPQAEFEALMKTWSRKPGRLTDQTIRDRSALACHSVMPNNRYYRS